MVFLLSGLVAGYLRCLACGDIVDHSKITRVSTHIREPNHNTAVAKHKAKKEQEKNDEKIQISPLTSFYKDTAKATPVVLDAALEAHRMSVISECLKYGLNPEQIANICEFLSTATKQIPSSASGVRDYIPGILERAKADAAALIGSRCASSGIRAMIFPPLILP